MNPISSLRSAVCILALLLTTGSAISQTFPVQIDDTVSDGMPGVGAGRIDVHTENDYYTFAGAAGQSVFLEEISASPSFAGWLRWELKSPGNVTVFSSYLEGNNEGRRTLPENGTYTLRVWVGSVNASYVGTYSFRLRAIPADPTFAIAFGGTITNGVPGAGAGNIEAPGAWDHYTFNATNGQIAFFESLSVASSFQGYLSWELRSPSSNLVFSSYVTAGNHPGRKVLTENGTYRMRLFAASTSLGHTGTYSLRMRSVTPDQTFTVHPGDTVTNNVPLAGAGNIDVPGAQDFYTFTGTAGQSLTFDGYFKSAAFAGWLQWEAKTPGGQTLFSAYFGNAGRKTLPETGTYTIRVWVGANNTSYVGNYAFQLITLPGDVRLNIAKGDLISDGVPAAGAGRIDEPGGLDAYTFSGIAGQLVNFDQLHADPAFAGWLYWQVVAPGGTNWFADFFTGIKKESRRLPETGNYTVRVFANAANTSYVGPYSFRIWCPVSAGSDQLATSPGSAIIVPLGKFLCNDTLEIGDAPSISVTNAATASGGSVSIVSNALHYTPPPGFAGLDRFTYRLRGLYGGEDFANVNVRVVTGAENGATVVSLVREGADSVMVCLFGAPNQTYAVEQSSNLLTWSAIGTVTADDSGSMTYHYSIEPVEKRFYRFRKQAQ